MNPKIILKPKREESLLRKHPWIFSGAIAEIIGKPGSGDTVDIYSHNGDFLARAAFSPKSNIQARVWTWIAEELINVDFFKERINNAIALRDTYSKIIPKTDAIRLIHGESDGLPGLIVDRYHDVLVVQVLTAGIHHWHAEIVSLLKQVSGITAIYERSDSDIRKLEGLDPQCGILWGQKPHEFIYIFENDLEYMVDIISGHKTGLYLDQRTNRQEIRSLASKGEVLDCFSYSGGFSINAIVGGATKVVSVDSSKDALVMLKRNIEINKLPLDNFELVSGDVFQVLRLFRDQGKKFDLIVLDPPKFAHTASMAGRAARGYKDINLLAFKLLRKGGLLATFSCSGGVSQDLFQKIVAGAALDAGVDARIIKQLHQDVDHPIALNFPEGAYLKGLVVSV